MKENYLKANYSNRTQNTGYDQKLVMQLLKGASSLLPGKVLDLACGTGGFYDSFSRLSYEYYGADIDNEQPERNIVKCDIGCERFPFGDNMFEVVFFKMGIEHLTLAEIAHCLGEVRRVLKPGGAAIILTPNWLCMYKTFYTEYTHQTPFTPSSLRTAIEMNGLKCVTSRSFIQLPAVWKMPAVEWVCNVAQLFYPLFSRYKFVRYSKERIVFALATK